MSNLARTEALAKGGNLRILHIDEQRTWRGGERQAGQLVEALVRRGHEVFIAGRPGSPFLQSYQDLDGLVRIAAPFVGEADPWTAWKLARAVKRHRIDIIHAHTSHAHSYACIARRLAGRGKVVVSRRVAFTPKGGWINRIKYNDPDMFVAVAKRVGEVLAEYGVPDSKIAVVHSCIDHARFEVEPIARAELDIPEGVPLIGNIAALDPVKDQLMLLEAMPKVLAAVPDLRLLIAGEGPQRAALEQRIRSLGLESTVTLLGFRSDVPRLLKALDIFVLTSKMEGIGGAVLEAMACGVPAVATAAGGVPEVVQDGKTGTLVPVGDSKALADGLIRVLQDRPHAARMAENAQAFVRANHNVERMVEGNIAVYEALSPTFRAPS